jgi:hypothetical protein
LWRRLLWWITKWVLAFNSRTQSSWLLR